MIPTLDISFCRNKACILLDENPSYLIQHILDQSEGNQGTRDRYIVCDMSDNRWITPYFMHTRIRQITCIVAAQRIYRFSPGLCMNADIIFIGKYDQRDKHRLYELFFADICSLGSFDSLLDTTQNRYLVVYIDGAEKSIYQYSI